MGFNYCRSNCHTRLLTAVIVKTKAVCIPGNVAAGVHHCICYICDIRSGDADMMNQSLPLVLSDTASPALSPLPLFSVHCQKQGRSLSPGACQAQVCAGWVGSASPRVCCRFPWGWAVRCRANRAESELWFLYDLQRSFSRLYISFL